VIALALAVIWRTVVSRDVSETARDISCPTITAIMTDKPNGIDAQIELKSAPLCSET